MSKILVKHQDDPALAEAVDRFSFTLGACETELVRAILHEPDNGMAAARSESVDAGWFSVFGDVRLIYIACAECHAYGRDVVVRMAKRLLESEREYVGLRGFDHFAESSLTACTSPFMQYLGVKLTAKSLGRMVIAGRDANAHLREACRLLESQVAA